MKIKFLLLVFRLRLEMRHRCDNRYKPGADGGNIVGQPMLFVCMGICVLSPVHESEMRGYLVYLLIVKYLLILEFSHIISDWTALWWNWGWGVGWGVFFETFLGGSV